MELIVCTFKVHCNSSVSFNNTVRVAMGIWEYSKGCNGNLELPNAHTLMYQITNTLVNV